MVKTTEQSLVHLDDSWLSLKLRWEKLLLNHFGLWICQLTRLTLVYGRPKTFYCFKTVESIITKLVYLTNFSACLVYKDEVHLLSGLRNYSTNFSQIFEHIHTRTFFRCETTSHRDSYIKILNLCRLFHFTLYKLCTNNVIDTRLCAKSV